MLLTLALTLTLAQTPELRGPVVVVVSTKRVGAEAVALSLVGDIRAVIERESGKPVAEAQNIDARTCQGAPDCLRDIAKTLGPHAIVVGVDAGKAGKSIAVRLEAVSADATESLATAEFLVTAVKWKDQTGAAVAVFAHNVVEKLPVPITPPPPPPTTASDAPTNTPLTPSVTARPQARPTSTQRILGFTTGAGALVAAGVGGVFLVLGLQDKAFVDAHVKNGVSDLPEDQIAPRASSANTRMTVALICGISAAALAVLAAVLFATD